VRLYYGWIIVAAALVMFTLILGSTMYAFGVFVRPVSEAFGLTRAEANTGYVLLTLGGAVGAPLMGKLLDRVPIRRIMLACALMLGLSLVALGLSQSLWLSAIILAVPLAFSVQGGIISANAVVARWFSVYRGRAMSIALFGMSLAGIIVTPAIAFSIESFAWRPTLISVGAIVTVLLVALLLVFREKPGPDDIESTKPAPAQAEAAPPAADAKPMTALTILAMPQFWAIAISTAITLGFSGAIMVSLVPLAEGLGVPPIQAASLIAILSFAGFSGGVVAAWISDRINRMLLLSIVYALLAAVALAFYFSNTLALLAITTALSGICGGIASPAFHALIADRFGTVSFGTAYGLTSVVMTIVSALAARYAGEVFDRTGSYGWLFLTIIVLQLIAAALMFGARMLPTPVAASAQPAHH
jgi:MFS family permease